MTTPPRETKRVGRPPIEITAKDLRLIAALAGYGLTEAAIADALEMDPKTFYRKKTLRPDVAKAIRTGKARVAGQVGEALVVKAKRGDVPAIRWYEMTRCGRREATSVEHGGAVASVELRPGRLTDAERADVLAALLARRA